MDETEVVRIVESTVSKENENLLASMKSFLDDSILKRTLSYLPLLGQNLIAGAHSLLGTHDFKISEHVIERR